MKQVTQRLRDGKIDVTDAPMPELRPEGVLVDVRASLLSAGTERTKVATGRQSLFGMARSRPDQVRQVLEKAKRDGVRETVGAVRSRLDQPAGLGYSCSGIVIGAGARVRDLRVGDRVACGGATATHSDVNYAPANLCVRLPNGVSFQEGAFTTVGSIALHGIRQSDAQVGERVAVIGLGLVGQLAGQILRAAGCSVLGVDVDAQLVERALENGAADQALARAELNRPTQASPVAECDAILITAATKSSDPVTLAAALARDRARVVVVGDVGLSLKRRSWYEKELELRLSRSYGPGRYDRDYEERGLDYPVGYVRWTERRNMEAFVELMAASRLDIRSLVTEELEIDDAPSAYDRLVDTQASRLGVLIRFEPTREAQPGTSTSGLTPRRSETVDGTPAARMDSVGVIGAGNFAQRVLIPSLRDAGFRLTSVASAGGLSATAAAARFGFERAGTVADVLTDPSIGLVAIATRHSNHAEIAQQALEAGKAVFVEKPPCLNEADLNSLRTVRQAARRPLIVGFNRRHSPWLVRLRNDLRERSAPLELVIRVNAGPLEREHWLNDVDDGGGRLLGEGCHFVDLACWLNEAVPTAVSCIGDRSCGRLAATQRFTVVLTFPDGSIATLAYGDGGADRLGKEYVEAHWQGRSTVIDDFRRFISYDGRRRRRHRSRSRDKGHRAQAVALRGLLNGRTASQPNFDPLDSMAVTFAALRSVETGRVAATQRAMSGGAAHLA